MRARKWMRQSSGLARVPLLFGLTTVLCASLIAGRASVSYFNVPVPELPSLKEQDRGIVVYDRDNHFLFTIHKDKDSKPIPLSKVSTNLIKAVLAIEDHSYYYHCGVDLQSILRAYMANREAKHVVQGGSTITQQLARNLYLDPNDRTYQRKIREIILAWLIERRADKEQILETYLNQIYFGSGVTGVERAAEYYFSKPASKLTIPEAAFIASLIKAPSDLSNPRNRSEAMERQQTVIRKMQEYSFISADEAKKALSVKPKFKFGVRQRDLYPYFVSYLLDTLNDELGDELWKRDWKVYSTLDVKVQHLADATMRREVRHAPKGINQGALVTMDIDTGNVLAMVGSATEYGRSQWNRAIYPHTAGSSFKPFVYLTALREGKITPDSIIMDSPIGIYTKGSPMYTPKNYDGRFMGPLTATQALAKSRNVCAVRVAMAAGIKNIVQTARAAGIHSRLDAYPSLALGACAVTPLEMSVAYSTFARGGKYLPPRAVRKIVDDQGDISRDYTIPEPKRVFDQGSVSGLLEMMQEVVNHGTGRAAMIPNLPIAGKTGTADHSRDIWFIGFTPKIVTAVWAGNDQNKRVRANVTGGSLMAKIWHDYTISFNKIHPPKPASFPFVQSPIASHGLELPGDGSSKTISDDLNLKPHHPRNHLIDHDSADLDRGYGGTVPSQGQTDDDGAYRRDMRRAQRLLQHAQTDGAHDEYLHRHHIQEYPSYNAAPPQDEAPQENGPSPYSDNSAEPQ